MLDWNLFIETHLEPVVRILSSCIFCVLHIKWVFAVDAVSDIINYKHDVFNILYDETGKVTQNVD